MDGGKNVFGIVREMREYYYGEPDVFLDVLMEENRHHVGPGIAPGAG